ncbi:MAG: FmdB family zinc ribbon protein [bacterium]
MPLYEYVCSKCGKKSEFLIRHHGDKAVCECGSAALNRVFSSFAVCDASSGSASGCSDGSCGVPRSPCASGMCGM